jgi:peptide/nickel transport system substrate-binding protein
MQKSHRLIVLLVLALLLPSVFTNTIVTAQDTGGEMIPRLNGGGMGGGSNPQPNYNPYSPNKLSGTENLVYEKLYYVNKYSCEQVPWLATEFTWVDPQTLTFTIRDGVAWSDGTPFTGADVVYTFETLKATKALDLYGATNGLETVTAEGSTVTFTFSGPAIPQWDRIAETMIVPKHIFEQQADLTTFINDNPVGTGPYTLGSMNSEELVWTLRPDYWGEPIKVQEIRFSKPAEGQADMLRLAKGEYDWNAMYIPNIEQVYVSQDPEHNKYWFGQGAPISIYFNLTKEPFNDVTFRKAVALAVDRDEIVEKAQLGYVTKASQTGLKLPGQSDWLNPEIPNEGYIDRNVEEAKKLLTDAGYTYDGDTLMTPAGAKVEFTFITPAGWADWIQAADIIKSNLAEIGITMTVETPDFTVLDTDRKTGNYEATFGVPAGQCSMYQNYNDPLGSAMSAPVGENAVSNWVRWQDPETDELLTQFLSATTAEDQKPIVHQLQGIVYNELPYITLWYGAVWFEYRTANAVGWPNGDDPYAAPGDLPLILPRLTAP